MMKLTDTIAVQRPTKSRESALSPRLPESLRAAFALFAFLVCSITGIVVAFLVIESGVALLDEESLLLFFVVIGGLSLVLAVPTLVKEALIRLFDRTGY
jgi:hypothetical protein